jgi:hypothetical protein
LGSKDEILNQYRQFLDTSLKNYKKDCDGIYSKILTEFENADEATKKELINKQKQLLEEKYEQLNNTVNSQSKNLMENLESIETTKDENTITALENDLNNA